MESQVKRVFDGLSLVAVGLVFLGNTTGVLPWSVWWNILSLWPLLLVSAGIDLIGKSLDSTWVRVLSSLVFIGGIAYAVFLMPADGWPGTLGFGGREQVEFSGEEGSAEGLRSAELRLNGPVGRLTLEAGGGSGLVAWDGRSSFGEPEVDVSEEDSRAVVRIDASDGPEVFLGPTRDARFDLVLNDMVPWSVRLDSGVGRMEADLSDLTVTRLELDSGIGDGTVILGDPDDEAAQVRVHSGISSLRLRVPEDAEVRVRVSSGIGSRDLPASFERAGEGVWETDGYDRARRSWEVVIDSGIGNLDIETY